MQERTKTDNLIEGETGDWEVIIGLEVHAQITSRSKLFSGRFVRTTRRVARTASNTVSPSGRQSAVPNHGAAAAALARKSR